MTPPFPFFRTISAAAHRRALQYSSKHIQPATGRRGCLSFARSLSVAADNLDSVGVDLMGVIQLKVDVFDDECPDVVAETVCVEMSLERSKLAGRGSCVSRKRNQP